MAEQTKDMKLQSKEDLMSALPDCLIQHVLSLLPSTKEAIQTTILSKRWHNQWTCVPVLIFDSTGMKADKFNRFIDYTLLMYDCSKVKKFHIETDPDHGVKDLNWHVIIRFAIRKNVEDLSLKMWLGHTSKLFSVPEFVFKQDSLVKLQMFNCDFSLIPNGSIKWGSLKALNIEHCELHGEAIENILSGSPSLESLELSLHGKLVEYVIVSKSLKKLVLNNIWYLVLQISCPNLEEFKLFGNILARTDPKLDCPSLICAHLDFDCHEHAKNKKFLIQHIQHTKELKFGGMFFKTLSILKLRAELSSMLLNNKSLTLDRHTFGGQSAGIECALHLSHVLEKLVIKLPNYKSLGLTKLPFKINVSNENYWNSNRTVFNCLVSHLKFVEINGLSEIDDECNIILSFIEFLLKNALVLEKFVVIILKDSEKDFVIKVSQKLLNFTRYSRYAKVELLCSK